jgi:hypothetical protein
MELEAGDPMTFRPEHEIYRRRLSRNLGVGGALLAFVVLVFLLTVVKVTHGEPMKGLHGTLGKETVVAPVADTGADPAATTVKP